MLRADGGDHRANVSGMLWATDPGAFDAWYLRFVGGFLTTNENRHSVGRVSDGVVGLVVDVFFNHE